MKDFIGDFSNGKTTCLQDEHAVCLTKKRFRASELHKKDYYIGRKEEVGKNILHC